MSERIFRIVSLLCLGLGMATSFASVDTATTPESMVNSAFETMTELQALHEAEQLNAQMAHQVIAARDVSADFPRQNMTGRGLMAVTKAQ